MLQQDASLAAAFEKLESPPPVGAGPSTVPAQQGGWGALLYSLTPEERQKMKQARAAVRNQPEVQQVEATRVAAEKQFRDALRTALLKADPAGGPLIDKVEAAMMEKKNAMRRGLEAETPLAP
jgi:hypothetical protein